MARNETFNQFLDEMRQVHEVKNHDYADDHNPYSNFETAALIAGIPVDKVFATMCGIKLERLRQLTSGKEPRHEGVEDTLLDLANYAAIWASWRRSRAAQVPPFPTAA